MINLIDHDLQVSEDVLISGTIIQILNHVHPQKHRREVRLLRESKEHRVWTSPDSGKELCRKNISMGTKVFLLRRPCEDSCVDELVSGMAVLREISLLDAEALLGRADFRVCARCCRMCVTARQQLNLAEGSRVSCRFRRSGREATLGMAVLVKTNRGWIDVRFQTHRLPRSCEVIGSNTHLRSSGLGQ
ncbi:LOW QUALITY PROTEIN: hypothetical protein HID58_031303 [Brassica napus]|uniref:Uncharacterized protein n=1 Tax=Brassica napus TaxID=3708 RepID=A0ABQ8CIH0_BRANA|nr:LOW QUALITY PROTEIN: hypothetical protein HID58_031303 [Brassica napus]